MKKILLLITMMVMSTIGRAQVAIDFEPNGTGNDLNWTVFENADAPESFLIIDNPDATGGNTSTKVAKFVARQAGQAWAGLTGRGVTPFVFDETNRIIKVMVWKTIISNVGVKLETNSGWAQPEIQVANTKVNEWEELTFDFTGRENPPSEQFTGVSFFPDFNNEGRTQDNTVYFDNFSYAAANTTAGGDPTTPISAAPIPMHAEGDVISVFSNSYTNLEGTDFNPNWGQTTLLSTVEFEGNETLKLAGLNYQGIQLMNTDISEMTHVHIDYWTSNSTALNMFLISPGPLEALKVLEVPTQGWNSIDIPLSEFTGVNLTEFFQFKFDGNGDIFIDNLYFHNGVNNNGVVEVSPIDFEVDGNGADWTWELFGGDANPALEIVDNPATTGANTSAKVAKMTVPAAGASWSGTSTPGIGEYVFDSANPIIKVMVWKSVISDVGVKLEAASGWSQGEVKVANTKTGEWEELTFDFTGKINVPLADGGAFGKVTFFPDFVEGRTQENVIYFDNIVFEGFNYLGGGGGEPTAPTIAAPVPTHSESDVIAVYSNSYTVLDGTDFNPGWGQSTAYSTVDLEGNEAIKLGALNYQGIALAGNNDVSGMTYLHLDYWTANSSALNVFLICPGPLEAGKALDVPTQGWNSIDIPLSEFTGVNLTEVFQFKFDGNGDIFIDNIYFHNGGDVTTYYTMPVTFEEGLDWSGATVPFEGSEFYIEGNPDMLTSNPSEFSAKLVKRADGQPWAGVFLDLDRPLNLMEKPIVSMMVRAPKENAPVLFKIENSNNTSEFIELEMPLGPANEWTEMNFDFSVGNRNIPYDRIVIIFDRETVGDGTEASTWYFDNIDYAKLPVVNFRIDMSDAIAKKNFNPAMHAVTISGDFNGWEAREDTLNEGATPGIFERAIEIAPGRHEFKFVYSSSQYQPFEWDVDPNRVIEIPNSMDTEVYLPTIPFDDYSNEGPIHKFSMEHTVAFNNGGYFMIPITLETKMDEEVSAIEFSFNYPQELIIEDISLDNSLFTKLGWDVAGTDDGGFVAVAGAGATSFSGYDTLAVIYGYTSEMAMVGEVYSIMFESVLVDENFNSEDYRIMNGSVYVEEYIAPKLGDVSMNGSVQAFDASLILKALVQSIELTDEQLSVADVTADMTVSAMDASIILQYLVGLVQELPFNVEQPAKSPKFSNETLELNADATQVSIPFTVSEVSTIFGFETQLSYDPTYLTFKGVDWSENLKGYMKTVGDNSGVLSIAGAGSKSTLSDGSFGKLRFELNEGWEDATPTVSIDRLRWNEGAEMKAVGNIEISPVTTGLVSAELPTEFMIEQNFPNPFNPSTAIKFALPQANQVRLTVFNTLGQSVATIVNQSMNAGTHTVMFEASALSSGMYFYRIDAGNYTKTMKMMLVK